MAIAGRASMPSLRHQQRFDFHPVHDPNSRAVGLPRSFSSSNRVPAAVRPCLALEQNQASKSKRPWQTVTRLAQALNVAPVLDFGKGQEAALARQVLAQSGVILNSWQHEAIGEIARNLVAGSEPRATIPAQWPDDRFDIVWIFEPPAKGKNRWKFTQVPQQLLPDDADAVIS